MNEQRESPLVSAFDLAILRRDGNRRLSGAEMREHMKVMDLHADQRAHAEQLLEQEFDERMDAARKIALSEAGGVNRAFKPSWSGQDRFDKTGIERKAFSIVRRHHEDTLRSIDQSEANALADLLGTPSGEDHTKPRLRPDFHEAVDRRKEGVERRQRSLGHPQKTR